MVEPIADQILEKLNQASQLYYRLILVVAPTGAGKTAALKGVRDRTGAPLINVNLELSRRMLDLTERQRALQLPRLIGDIIGNDENTIVLLDNIEVLFDVNLKQDPLRLIEGLSRSKTLVVAWNGSIIDNSLIYADPSHPEYRRYPVHDFLIVAPEAIA